MPRVAFPIRWFNFFPPFRFCRHSGASRNLRATMNSAFRQSDGFTPYRFSRHSGFPSFPILPSFRRKPESTRHDGLRFSPERRIHTIPTFPSFRRKPESIRRGIRRGPGLDLPTTVIPAKAGIYPPRRTPGPGLTCLQPSFRRKPESTRHDELRFAPERRRACQTT